MDWTSFPAQKKNPTKKLALKNLLYDVSNCFVDLVKYLMGVCEYECKCVCLSMVAWNTKYMCIIACKLVKYFEQLNECCCWCCVHEEAYSTQEKTNTADKVQRLVHVKDFFVRFYTPIWIVTTRYQPIKCVRNWFSKFSN